MDAISQTSEGQAPAHLTRAEIERVSREFTLAYHDLKEQTFATTTWLRVPLLKTATDMLAFQQLIAETRPELIVETGVYVGGSALMFASIQELMGVEGKVIAIDVDLSLVHERVREHPRIELLEGSSLDPAILARIRAEAEGRRVMVDLDADHRAQHVIEELRTYAPLVTPGCYLVVEDGFLGGRPVRPDVEAGPSDALEVWLAEGGQSESFLVDRWQERFLMTQNPRGYLRRLGAGGEGAPRPPRPERFQIGALELSRGEDGADAERSAAALAAAPGDPDREVEALHDTLEGLVGNAGTDGGDARTERLLREIHAQRELLRERNRIIAREQARLRRFTGSLPYRAYRRLRSLPVLRHGFQRLDRRRAGRARARSARRAHARRKRGERFDRHHDVG